jgi:hypothetical protein
MLLEQILAEAKALAPEEQQQLCDALTEWLSNRQLSLTEKEFEQHLKNQGLLREIPAPITDLSAYAQRKPVRVSTASSP